MKKIKNNKRIFAHIDADAFFASVEQVLHRELQGKPIVVGQNGGIVSALSYPAKNMGVQRVTPIQTVRKKFPEVQVVSSDSHAYNIFSQRMRRIILRHIPELSKSSIDECGAEITSLVSGYKEAETFVENLQKELYEKLGCTFSFGLAYSPLVAKLASGMNKPSGVTIITPENMDKKAGGLPIAEISGIGKQTAKKLAERKIVTISDYIGKNLSYVEKHFSKPLRETWAELNGTLLQELAPTAPQKSMSKCRTFMPTSNMDFLLSQMFYNIEYLSRRMREGQMRTQRVGLSLRKSDLSWIEKHVNLEAASSDPETIFRKLKPLICEMYEKGVEYRAVSVSCAGLSNQPVQIDLFGGFETKEDKKEIFTAMDSIEKRFGTASIGFAGSMMAAQESAKVSARRVAGDVYPHALLPGEAQKKRLKYPFLGSVA